MNSLNNNPHNDNFDDLTPRVIVLGAGISGLACARELVHRGYRVLVVEARDRVGGRLKGCINKVGGILTDANANTNATATTASSSRKSSPSLSGGGGGAAQSSDNDSTTAAAASTSTATAAAATTPIDLGGALIHGIDENPIYEIAKQMGIRTRPVSDCLLMGATGWPVDSKQDERIAGIFNECLEETFRRISTSQSSKTNIDHHTDNDTNKQLLNKGKGEEYDKENVNDENTEKNTEKNSENNTNDSEDNKDKNTEKNAVHQDEVKAEQSPSNGKVQLSPASEPELPLAPEPSKSSNTASSSSTYSSSSFGELFDIVCNEKGLNSNMCNHPLFLWHKVNLEVSCGASFHDLGYTWNDDEPYGFAGDHVALENSWDAVVQGLADGLDVMYSSPVSQIHVVPNVPISPPRSAKRTDTERTDNDKTSKDEKVTSESENTSSSEEEEEEFILSDDSRTTKPSKKRRILRRGVVEKKEEMKPTRSSARIRTRIESKKNLVTISEEPEPEPTVTPVSNNKTNEKKKGAAATKKKRGRRRIQNGDVDENNNKVQVKKAIRSSTRIKSVIKRAAKILLPSRRSRRIKGEDVNLRRSSRMNKGIITDRFCITNHSSLTYHGDSEIYEEFQRQKQQERESRKRERQQDMATTADINGENVHGNSSQQVEEQEDHQNRKSVVQISLQNGTVLEADAVVCTLPLGILKHGLCYLEDNNVSTSCEEKRGRGPSSDNHSSKARGKTSNSQDKREENANDREDNLPEEPEAKVCVKFYPPLSERKQLAIQRLGCGLLNKCALSFSHIFWQDTDFLGLADTQASYLVLNAARYTKKPILVFMYGGSFAREIESWTDHEIVEDCMLVLKKICNIKAGGVVPRPLDYMVTRWGKEKYSNMAFSYVPPGVDGAKELETISEPIYDHITTKTIVRTTSSSKIITKTKLQKPIMMFAGEHTTPYHPSTIHGAFLSGIREAYRFDLYMEPKLNGNLIFQNDQLYHYTFPVRRIFSSNNPESVKSMKKKSAATTNNHKSSANKMVKKKSSSSSTSTEQQSQQHCRRRRRGAATTLRNPSSGNDNKGDSNTGNSNNNDEPAGHSNGNVETVPSSSSAASSSKTSATTAAEQVTDSPEKLRRSQRSLSAWSTTSKAAEAAASTAEVTKNGKKNNTTSSMNNGSRPNSSNDLTIYDRIVRNHHRKILEVPPPQKEDLVALERRVLIRAIESYGPDYLYVKSKVLPIYDGNSNNNTAINNGTSSSRAGVLQVRARCRHLIGGGGGSRRSSRDNNDTTTDDISENQKRMLLKYWMAKRAYRVPPQLVSLYDTTKKRS